MGQEMIARYEQEQDDKENKLGRWSNWAWAE